MASNDSYEILGRHRETIDQCFRCGLCRSVCPSFEEIGLESPRRRAAEFNMRPRCWMASSVSNRRSRTACSIALNCMRCGETCPSGCAHGSYRPRHRAEMAKRGKLNIVKKLAFNTVLRSRFLFSAFLHGSRPLASGGSITATDCSRRSFPVSRAWATRSLSETREKTAF